MTATALPPPPPAVWRVKDCLRTAGGATHMRHGHSQFAGGYWWVQARVGAATYDLAVATSPARAWAVRAAGLAVARKLDLKPLPTGVTGSVAWTLLEGPAQRDGRTVVTRCSLYA